MDRTDRRLLQKQVVFIGLLWALKKTSAPVSRVFEALKLPIPITLLSLLVASYKAPVMKGIKAMLVYGSASVYLDALDQESLYALFMGGKRDLCVC